MILTGNCLQAITHALSGAYRLTLCDGHVQVICRHLPGRAIATAVALGETLWILIDIDKPSATLHAREMVLTWFADGPWAGRQTEAEIFGQLSSIGTVTELSLVSP